MAKAINAAAKVHGSGTVTTVMSREVLSIYAEVPASEAAERVLERLSPSFVTLPMIPLSANDGPRSKSNMPVQRSVPGPSTLSLYWFLGAKVIALLIMGKDKGNPSTSWISTETKASKAVRASPVKPVIVDWPPSENKRRVIPLPGLAWIVNSRVLSVSSESAPEIEAAKVWWAGAKLKTSPATVGA